MECFEICCICDCVGFDEELWIGWVFEVLRMEIKEIKLGELVFLFVIDVVEVVVKFEFLEGC